jgi:hypothetical protein
VPNRKLPKANDADEWAEGRAAADALLASCPEPEEDQDWDRIFKLPGGRKVTLPTIHQGVDQ